MHCIDREATCRLIERVRPDFLFIDRSEGLRYEDFSFHERHDRYAAAPTI